MLYIFSVMILHMRNSMLTVKTATCGSINQQISVNQRVCVQFYISESTVSKLHCLPVYVRECKMLFGKRTVSTAYCCRSSPFRVTTAATPEFAALITGHGKTKSYLHKFKLADDLTCPCNEGQQTSDHIIFECNIVEAQRSSLIKHITVSAESWTRQRTNW
jgi:hypothetical protein